MTASLAERLRTETRALHTAAERSRFMGVLLRGRMDRASYCALLRNLHAIYAALEPVLARHAGHPVLAPVFLPRLARTRALADDLLALHGSGWPDAFALQPATLRYVRRLREIDSAQPELLFAHAYVRYLGDLSGGQMLRRVVAGGLRLPPGIGTAFYDFGDAAETLALTHAFRAGMGRIPAAPEVVSALVGEAVLAFELHRVLFDELAAACGLDDAPDRADSTV